MSEAAIRYDRYWEERDEPRTRARSLARAELVLELLALRGARPGATLLEIGCGPGHALERLRDAGFAARGIDFSALAVERARARGLDASVVDIEREPIPGELADIVVSLEVLEHLADPLAAIRAFARHVRPGGALLVSLPNEFHLVSRMRILVGRPSFGGHEDPHLRHFGRRTARAFFRAAELRVVAERHDSIVPPRWRLARRIVRPFASWLPGLLAISSVHLLEGET